MMMNNSLKKIKKISITAIISLISTVALGNSGGAPLDRAPDLANDKAALQHGAKLFVNYCLNCHNAASMRYNRLKDLGLSDEQIRDNLLFSGDKVGDMMKVALAPKDAKEWFGAIPPDLSVIARAKSGEKGSGADYIYTYLRSYYRDNSRPTGWNNVVYPNVAMPHVLWDLQPARSLEKIEVLHLAHTAHQDIEKNPSNDITQATQEAAVFEKVVTTYDTTGVANTVKTPLPHYGGHEQTTYNFVVSDKDNAGQRQFDKDIADLTAFMQYMADPSASTRQSLGVWVLLFLAIFILLTYLLNKEYWKDIK